MADRILASHVLREMKILTASFWRRSLLLDLAVQALQLPVLDFCETNGVEADLDLDDGQLTTSMQMTIMTGSKTVAIRFLKITRSPFMMRLRVWLQMGTPQVGGPPRWFTARWKIWVPPIAPIAFHPIRLGFKKEVYTLECRNAFCLASLLQPGQIMYPAPDNVVAISAFFPDGAEVVATP